MYCNGRAPRPALIGQLGERKTEGRYVQTILRPRVRFTVKALPMRYIINKDDYYMYVDVKTMYNVWKVLLLYYNGESTICNGTYYGWHHSKYHYNGNIVDTWEYLLHNIMEIYFNIPGILYLYLPHSVMRWVSRP